MSYAEAHDVALTTDASGDVTGYTPAVTGRILTVIFTDTDFDAGADITVTGDLTAQAILTLTNQAASGTFAPRQATHDIVGAASLHAAAGEPVEDYIWVCQEKVKVVVAQGGNVKSAVVTVIVG